MHEMNVKHDGLIQQQNPRKLSSPVHYKQVQRQIAHIIKD